MEWVLLIVGIANLVVLLGVANAVVRLSSGQSDEDTKESYMAGYSEGGLDTMYFIKGNLARHREILPPWLPEWFDHMIAAYKKKRSDAGLSDVPMKYEGQSDYSNVLEQAKLAPDIKLVKDE